MNREVHVRFWESAGLQCPAPLAFIKAYGSVSEARQGIGSWLSFYNEERPHQALAYRTPREVFDGKAYAVIGRASAMDGCGVATRRVGGEEKGVLTYVE